MITKRLLLAAALLVATSGAALAECWSTQYIFNGGRSKLCTTCCVGNQCTTFCT